MIAEAAHELARNRRHRATEEGLHTAHDLLAVAGEVRQLAQVDPPGHRDQPPTRAAVVAEDATRR